MSKIQITDEISTRLSRLKVAIAESTNFSKASHLTFENTDLSSLTGYQRVIQTVGSLGEQYRSTFTKDIVACEQIIENNRALDQQVAQAMKATILGG